jgi:excisionase family DNA binding protein
MTQAAELLSVSRRTIERMIASRQIAKTKVRGRSMIALQEIERFVRAQRGGER